MPDGEGGGFEEVEVSEWGSMLLGQHAVRPFRPPLPSLDAREGRLTSLCSESVSRLQHQMCAPTFSSLSFPPPINPQGLTHPFVRPFTGINSIPVRSLQAG